MKYVLVHSNWTDTLFLLTQVEDHTICNGWIIVATLGERCVWEKNSVRIHNTTSPSGMYAVIDEWEE